MACPNANCSWDWCSMDCDKLRIGRIKACSICVKDLSVDGLFSAMSLNSLIMGSLKTPQLKGCLC